MKKKKKGGDEDEDDDWMSEFIGTTQDLDMDAITGTGSAAEEKKEEEKKSEPAEPEDEDDPFAVNVVQRKTRRKKKAEEEERLEEVFYINEIKHSFCKTVHKSQGSEYKYVILYIPKNMSGFLNVNLLYTAITRTKQKIWKIFQSSTHGRFY